MNRKFFAMIQSKFSLSFRESLIVLKKTFCEFYHMINSPHVCDISINFAQKISANFSILNCRMQNDASIWRKQRKLFCAMVNLVKATQN